VTPTPRVIVERFYDAWNARDVEKLQSLADDKVTGSYAGAVVRVERVVAETDDTVVVEVEKGDGLTCEIVQVRDGRIVAIRTYHAPREAAGIVEEQAALRRVAELVARGVAQEELFGSVASQASKLIADEATTLLRFDDDERVTVVATCGGPAALGTRFAISIDDDSTPAEVLRTGHSARRDRYDSEAGPAYAQKFMVGSSVGVPIVVEERIWGMLGATTEGRRLPVAAEQRLQQFAELVAAALANAQARTELQRLADEHAALRRVAELVARGVPPQDLFAAVASEAGHLAHGEAMTLTRFESDHELVVMASSGGPAPIGQRITFEPDTLPDRVLRAGGTTRVDDYTQERDAELAVQFGLVASVAAAISVDGRVWGMLTATSAERPLEPGTEHRLGQFADLVGAAIANAENRAQLTASRARVVATADESRRRLQRDVHDGAQQRLVQTVIMLRLAKDELDAGTDSAPEMVAEALRHAERASTALREVVRGILPASLSRGGLRAGIESLVADAPLPVDVEVTALRLDPSLETTAYFVVAEALTNVLKHAGAHRARIEVAVEDEVLRIDVSDDGAGGADASRGSGLTGLLDRIEAGEGTLRVESAVGEGTLVAARLPLHAPRVVLTD
jgi:signal transduction histidine kinase